MNLLQQFKELDGVKVKKHEGLYICTYSNLGVDWNNELYRMARGIVLNRQGEVVARPYKKFFNYQELQNRDDLSEDTKLLSLWGDEEYVATEKIDGSLAIVFWNPIKNCISYATSSSLSSDLIDSIKDYIENKSNINLLLLKNYAKECTLTFEYTSKNNKVVINYPKESVILHSIKETKTGREIPYNDLVNISNDLNVDLVKSYPLTKEELLEKLETAEDLEGFVILFKSGKRLKLKTNWYFERHRSVGIYFGKVFTNANYTYVFEALENDTLDDLFAESSIRNATDVLTLLNAVLSLNKEWISLEKKALDYLKMDDKVVAAVVKDSALKTIIFLLKKDGSLSFFKHKWFITRLTKMFKEQD